MGTNPASEKCEVSDWSECPRCGHFVETPTEEGCSLCSTPSTSTGQHKLPPALRSTSSSINTQVSEGVRRQLFKEDVDEVKKNSCEECGKTFTSSGKLSQHMFIHTGERPFACDTCHKAFSSKFKLVRHVLIHSDTRQFVCSVCHRTFHRKDHLKNHAKVHSPVKRRYKCDREGCYKEYSSALSFRKHTAVHFAQDGNLECKMCGAIFETQQEVLFHLKIHSGSRSVKNQSDKKYKCIYCDRKFFTGKDVRRHLVVHTGKRDFQCTSCPQRFGRKDHLVRHIKKSHSGPNRRRKRTTRSVGSIVEEVIGSQELILPDLDLPEEFIAAATTADDSLLIASIMDTSTDALQLPEALPTFNQAFPSQPPPPQPDK